MISRAAFKKGVICVIVCRLKHKKPLTKHSPVSHSFPKYPRSLLVKHICHLSWLANILNVQHPLNLPYLSPIDACPTSWYLHVARFIIIFEIYLPILELHLFTRTTTPKLQDSCVKSTHLHHGKTLISHPKFVSNRAALDSPGEETH